MPQTRTLRPAPEIRYGLLSAIGLLSLSIFMAGATLPSLRDTTPVSFANFTALPEVYEGGYAELAAPETTATAYAPARAPLHQQDVAALPPAVEDLPPVPRPVASALPKKTTRTLERFAQRMSLPSEILKENVVEARAGDTPLTLLKAAGASSLEAQRMSAALGRLWRTSDLRAGHLFSVVQRTDTVGGTEGMYIRRDALSDVMVQRKGASYAASLVSRPVTTETITVTGVVRDSLIGKGAADRGLPASVRSEIVRAFRPDIDFERDIAKADRYTALYETRRDEDGAALGGGTLLSASLTVGGKEKTLYAFQQDGKTTYFDRDGMSAQKAMLRAPVAGARITSGFGMRRHPILRYSKMHRGIDFGIPIGTPVRAAGDGVIKVAGRLGGYGNYLRLQHSSTYETAYGHLSRFAPGVRPGALVKQGQIIAYSGNTGRSTGPHLHYEVLQNNAQINPQTAKVAMDTRLTGRTLAQFQNQVRRARQALRTSGPARTVAQLNR